jgi:hypothetical protein
LHFSWQGVSYPLRFPSAAKLCQWGEAKLRLIEKVSIGPSVIAHMLQAGVGQKDWHAFASELLAHPVREEMDEHVDGIASALAVVSEWFVTRTQRPTLLEAKQSGGYAVKDGMVYFRGADLAAYVLVKTGLRVQHGTVRAAYATLRIQGSTPVFVGHGTVAALNRVPLDSVAELLRTREQAPRVEGL